MTRGEAADAGADTSAVIVNYNAGDHLRAAVASTLAAGVGVVVVDNASTDASLECLADLTNDGRLAIIRNRRNLGFAAACNLGAAATDAPRLLFLNPDCVLEAEALGRLRAALDAAPDIGAVGARLLNPDGTEQIGSRRRFPHTGSAIRRAFGPVRGTESSFEMHAEPVPAGPLEVDAVSGACMLVRRAAADAVGGWDEAYFFDAEDLDLCRRLHDAGWRIVFEPRARGVHRRGVSRATRPLVTEWHRHRGMQRYFGKFLAPAMAPPGRWLVVSGIWARFAARAIAISIARLGSAGRN